METEHGQPTNQRSPWCLTHILEHPAVVPVDGRVSVCLSVFGWVDSAPLCETVSVGAPLALHRDADADKDRGVCFIPLLGAE